MSFTLPLTLGLLGVIAIGVLPLIVVSISAESDALLVPLIGSFALAAICTAVVAWLTALVISGVVVMVFYRIGPRAASGLVTRIGLDSFARIEDNTGRIALLTLVGGLIALAFGLPLQTGNESTTTVLDDLLAAQLACLIAALSIAFVAESIRCAADIVDDQSLLLAWPWALVIASAGWVAGYHRRAVRDHPDDHASAERMVAASGRGPPARPGDCGSAARRGQVVGGVRAAAGHRGDLGVRGVAP